MARPIPRAPPVITATRSPTLRSPRRADALRAGGYMGLLAGSAIHLSAVPDLDHEKRSRLIIDRVDHTVRSLPHAIPVLAR